MKIRISTARLGGIARRVATQAAFSVSVMAGLHFAGLGAFSPGAILFGPEREADAPPPTAAREGDAPAPKFRFVAVPAAEAFPAEPAATRSRQPAEASPPIDGTAGPTTLAANSASANDACGAVCRMPVAVPVKIARPTPRPDPAALASAKGTAEKRRATRIAQNAPTRPAPMSASPQPAPLWAAATPSPVPELVRDEIPEPVLLEDRSFTLSDLVPDRRRIVDGATSAGAQAVGAIGDIATGAFGLVRP